MPSYDAIAHVRFRPGMYLGTDLWALHRLVDLAVDNVVTLAERGQCSHLWITLQPGQSIVIRDDGPGIPVETYPAADRPIAELIFTKAAGRYDAAHRAFISSLFATGLSTLNALSAHLSVEIKRDGYVWQQHFAAGRALTDLIRVRALAAGEGTGTILTFAPDFTIMKRNRLQFDILADRLQDLSLLTPGLTITLRDERIDPVERIFHTPGGLFTWLQSADALASVAPILGEREVEIPFERYDNPRRSVRIVWGCQYRTTPEPQALSFAHHARLLPGQPHMFGLRDALMDGFNQYAIRSGLLAADAQRLLPQDIRNGLRSIVHFPELHTTSQPDEGRSPLDYPELREVMYTVVCADLAAFAEQHPHEMATLVSWLLGRRS